MSDKVIPMPARNGHQAPLLMLVPRDPFILRCLKPGCTYRACARNEGQAIRSLSAHIVHAHRGPQGEAA